MERLHHMDFMDLSHWFRNQNKCLDLRNTDQFEFMRILNTDANKICFPHLNRLLCYTRTAYIMLWLAGAWRSTIHTKSKQTPYQSHFTFNIPIFCVWSIVTSKKPMASYRGCGNISAFFVFLSPIRRQSTKKIELKERNKKKKMFVYI